MFLSPNPAFWGLMAAVGVAVPIAIHLFSRYRSRIVDWAAMELLRRALVVRARRVRLEDLILLLLRCLAILILALALARPALRNLGAIGEANVGVVIAVDSSYSMGHNPAGESRYDAARERMREIVSTLKPDDRVTVVQLGEKAHVRWQDVGRNDERLQNFIAGSAPLPEALNLDACVPELRRIVGDMKTTKKECYLLTDAQKTSFAAISGGVRDAIHDVAADCEVVFVPVGSENYENLAITRLALAAGVLRKGRSVSYVVDVENTGRADVSTVPVKLLVGNRVVSEQAIDRISAGETASISMQADFPEEGAFAVKAELRNNDPLSVDNSCYTVCTVRNRAKILCVETKPVADPNKNESSFLYALFAGGPSLLPGYEPAQIKTVAATALQASDLEGVDVAILTDVSDISRAQADVLANFAKRGGGLIVFAGSRMNGAQANSQFRDADGHEILPASLGDPIGQSREMLGVRHGGSSFQGWTLAAAPPDHPLTRPLATLTQQQLAELRVQRYLRAAPYAGARVLLTLTTGDPFLIERPLGRGAVLLCTTSANLEWTDTFPMHSAFAMLLHQAVMYMTGQISSGAAMVGQEITCRVPAGATADDCRVSGPNGSDVLFHLATGQDGQQDAIFTAEQPGVYTLKAGNREVKAAANVDTKESQVEVLRGHALETALTGLPLRLVEPGQSLRGTETETRHGREIWRILLFVALAVLVIEALLSRWFGHRLSEESAPAIRTTTDISGRAAGRSPQETPVGAGS